MQEEKLQTCKNLASALEAAQISRADLAKRAGVTEASISRYLSGKAEPRSAELLRLADALGTSMEFLLTGVDRVAASAKVAESVVDYTTSPRALKLPDPAEIDQLIRTLEANLRALQRFRSSFEEAEKVVAFPDQTEIRTELPFYGWVAAGKPADVDFHTDESRSVPGDYQRKPHYLLRVRGRSMEPDYPEGSYVVVRALQAGEFPKKGDVVIANDPNGPAMKRLEYRKAGAKSDVPRKPTPHLVSINPEFGEVIPISDCPIQGVVVESLPASLFDV